MVKFRGIEISVISQFDICKLPEFKHSKSSNFEQYDRNPFQADNKQKSPLALSYPKASCYVPIYPGGQIWFEYCIDGPHPAQAAYLFKLIVNNKVITSWDCTAKHGFHGKMMYNLVSEGVDPDTGRNVIKRQAIRFGDGLEDCESGAQDEDVVQINVYRIEHRKRLREIEIGLGRVEITLSRADGVRLTDSGLVEPRIHPRRYKYQLLDPIDVPYAAFEFHCHPYEFLEERNIQCPHGRVSPSTSTLSTLSQDSINGQAISDTIQHASPENMVVKPGLADSILARVRSLSPSKKQKTPGSTEAQDGQDAEAIPVTESMTRIPLSNSDDSLSVKTKDSIEELSSSVPRSPKKSVTEKASSRDNEIPPSPTRSPRHRLTKKLTISTKESHSDAEKKRRPLSPFTRGGMLRIASKALSISSATTEGTSVGVESTGRFQANTFEAEGRSTKDFTRTTADERGGKKLMGLLGRRIASEKDD